MTLSAMLSSPWITLLGLTLLHSLWQGTLIALALAMALRLGRQQSAQQRYGWCLTAMLLWIAAAGLTLLALSGDSASAGSATLSRMNPGGVTGLIAGQLTGRLDPARLLPFFVLFWLAGVTLMSLRTAAGLYGVLRLQRDGLQPLPAGWPEQIGHWLREWGVERPVPVRLSRRIQVPLVAGFFRQTLLLPLSFFTSLPPDQVKAILAHEVAHYLRRDGLVNLLQTLMETLFFFHPALWWISSRMRREREFCCDDFAIAQCGRPLHLARALLELQNQGAVAAAPAPLPSAAGELKTRIERLYTMKEKAMDVREKMLALVVLIGLGMVLVPLQGLSKALTPAEEKKKKIEVRVESVDGEEKTVTVTSSDTTGEDLDKLITIAGDKGHRHVIKMKDGKVVSATRDGQAISLDSLKDEMIVRELKEWREEDAPRVFTIETSGEDSTRKQIRVKVRKAADDAMVWTDGGDEAKAIILESSDGDSLHKIIRVKVEDAIDSTGRHENRMRKHVMVVHEKDRDKIYAKHAGSLGKEIRAELLRDGIIKDGKAVEFKLMEKELLINGVKQSADACKKYQKMVSKRMGLDGDEKMEVKLNLQEEKE